MRHCSSTEALPADIGFDVSVGLSKNDFYNKNAGRINASFRGETN